MPQNAHIFPPEKQQKWTDVRGNLGFLLHLFRSAKNCPFDAQNCCSLLMYALPENNAFLETEIISLKVATRNYTVVVDYKATPGSKSWSSLLLPLVCQISIYFVQRRWRRAPLKRNSVQYHTHIRMDPPWNNKRREQIEKWLGKHDNQLFYGVLSKESGVPLGCRIYYQGDNSATDRVAIWWMIRESLIYFATGGNYIEPKAQGDSHWSRRDNEVIRSILWNLWWSWNWGGK
jgi:hypothetical protein